MTLHRGSTRARFFVTRMDDERRNLRAFLWHAVFLSITVTFTEINTVIPALILEIGGRELHVGIAAAIMTGVPLVSQLFFSGLLLGKSRKKPYLITAISLRVVSLFAIAATILYIGSVSVPFALAVIYAELLVFTTGGAFAGISYVDILGKSLS
ncbi:MAG: hypothetical protein JXM71_03120, partial [Spirochaetales bacterium]|nr:hypothetical protein [Spirochaetales bacterium]